MNKIFIFLSVLFTGFCIYIYGSVAVWAQNKLKTKQEYTLEILNQDSVQIYSPSTNTTYKCEMERIEEILIVDNL